jgi:hypothetical protein
VAKYHLNLALIFPFSCVPHGFSRRLLAGLGRCGLAAAAEREVMKAGCKAVEVVRLK